MMAAAAPSSGETTPARAPPGCPAHHPLDDTFDDGAHISNIESFVVSTVPLVPALDAERPAGEGGAEPSADGADPPGPSSREKTRDHFALRDLWAFFDEWSAYGVEVPLTLDDEDHEVFQYYVPFLSGIQLFRSTEVEPSRANATNARDARETKDDDDDDDDENGPAGSGFLPLPSGIDAATRKGESVPGRELVFSYFEQASPYARAPLADTAERLNADHPELFALTSDKLHPASWMSVAWYPIYRIPVGQTLRDLSACFLTYHALSTATRAGEDFGTDQNPTVDGETTSDEQKTSGSAESEMDKPSREKNPTGEKNDPGSGSVSVPAHLRGCPAPPPASATGEAAMASRANRLIGSDPSGRRRIRLRAFGLAYYKLRSELWRPAEVADWLKTMQGGARAWLRGQKVIHPDFEFFSHRG